MTAPDPPSDLSKFFDMRLNVPSLIALLMLIFSAAFGLSKFETKEAHDADIRVVQEVFQRKDVSSVTDRELREWMVRIETKLDEMERDETRKRRGTDAR